MSTHDDPAPPRPTLPRGCRLALDVGTVRIGVARSDPDGILATPLTTVRREPRADVRAIAAIVADEAVACVYVGLPRTLRGGDSTSTTLARDVARELAAAVHPVPVHLVDERLSTVDASRMMRDSGRRAREQRAAIDSAAAVVILQTALDRERAGVTRAGERVDGAQWGSAPARVPGARPAPPPVRSGSVTPAAPAPHTHHLPAAPGPGAPGPGTAAPSAAPGAVAPDDAAPARRARKPRHRRTAPPTAPPTANQDEGEARP